MQGISSFGQHGGFGQRPGPFMMNPFQMMEQMEREMFGGMGQHPQDDFFGRSDGPGFGPFQGGMRGGGSLFDQMEQMINEEMMRGQRQGDPSGFQ